MEWEESVFLSCTKEKLMVDENVTFFDLYIPLPYLYFTIHFLLHSFHHTPPIISPPRLHFILKKIHTVSVAGVATSLYFNRNVDPSMRPRPSLPLY